VRGQRIAVAALFGLLLVHVGTQFGVIQVRRQRLLDYETARQSWIQGLLRAARQMPARTVIYAIHWQEDEP
jgi:hypothetical protein